MLLIAYVFSKIQTAKDLVRPMSQKYRLEHVKGSKNLWYLMTAVLSNFFITLRETVLKYVSPSDIQNLRAPC